MILALGTLLGETWWGELATIWSCIAHTLPWETMCNVVSGVTFTGVLLETESHEDVTTSAEERDASTGSQAGRLAG